MSFFVDSFFSALSLMRSLDPELMTVVGVSLKVSALSTLVATLLGVPLGLWIGFTEFPGKRGVITLLNTLLALPTVVIGLFVYSFISRRGIFGPLDLLYTQNAIVIGQFFLILPIVATFTLSAISRLDGRYRKTAMTLGATRVQTGMVILREARFAIMAAVVAAFGRVI